MRRFCLPVVVALAVSSQPRLVRGQFCDFSGGQKNEDGECVVCISEINCCILNEVTFDLTCDPFCVGVEGGQGQACGSALCQGSPQGTPCNATILVPADGGSLAALTIDWTCDIAGSCTCDVATWNGEDCDACQGTGAGYDCSNVEGGLCYDAGSCQVSDNTTATTQPPRPDLERAYRTDAEFRAEVERLSLPAAAEAAGVLIGAAIPDKDTAGLYEKYVPSHYNAIVAENAMKWNKLLKDDSVLGEYDFSKADEIVNYARSVGAKVRGHVLIWGRNRGITYPDPVAVEVEASTNPGATLLGIMKDHIDAVGKYFADRVDVWDVVNEHLTSMIDDNIFYTTFGDAYVKHAFLLAKDALPNSTRLVWNEALSEFGFNNTMIAWWVDKLKQYKEEGVPIDTVGIQGHSIASTHDLDALGAFFQAAADMGYDVELTEVDAPVTLFLDQDDPFAAQGEYLRKYASACLNTGRCQGITFWGLDDSSTWLDAFFPQNKPNLPLLIDEVGYEKPAWLGIREAFETASSGSDSTPQPTEAPMVSPNDEPTKAPVISPNGEPNEARSGGAVNMLSLLSCALLLFSVVIFS